LINYAELSKGVSGSGVWSFEIQEALAVEALVEDALK